MHVPSGGAATLPAPTKPVVTRPPAARVAVLGASGYAGQELVRLALAHPGLHVAALVSREQARMPAETLLVGLDPSGIDPIEVLTPEELPGRLSDGQVDTIVACLPHGAWRSLTIEQPALARAPRVIDLSSDHRDGRDDYVYGLPEVFRDGLAGATRIANPGCYATAASLALLPAAEHGWLAGPAMFHALSGASGAGRSAQLHTGFVELEGNASIYRAGTEHAHVPEIERTLASAGARIPVGLVPALASMSRGILLSANAPLGRPVAPEEAYAAYVERYASEPFVRVLPLNRWPETRAVRHSNRCDVAVTTLHGGSTLLVAAAIDNLVKGAAGQALQNLNLALGWPETTGLARHGMPW